MKLERWCKQHDMNERSSLLSRSSNLHYNPSVETQLMPRVTGRRRRGAPEAASGIPLVRSRIHHRQQARHQGLQSRASKQEESRGFREGGVYRPQGGGLSKSDSGGVTGGGCDDRSPAY